jgi:hypothetical protein
VLTPPRFARLDKFIGLAPIEIHQLVGVIEIALLVGRELVQNVLAFEIEVSNEWSVVSHGFL